MFNSALSTHFFVSGVIFLGKKVAIEDCLRLEVEDDGIKVEETGVIEVEVIENVEVTGGRVVETVVEGNEI